MKLVLYVSVNHSIYQLVYVYLSKMSSYQFRNEKLVSVAVENENSKVCGECY